MTTFYCLPCSDFSHNTFPFTIATGPVVISKNKEKVLLHQSHATGKWQFIGGRYNDHMTFRESALHHGQEVVGNNTITLLDEEHPVLLMDEVDLREEEEQVLLIHYKALIDDESNIGDASWFTLDEVMMLDAKEETSSSNIRIITEKFLA
ncbi:MAG: hypothetical protein HHAS10_04340 [Candidatus Altimarinota bacterium]